MKGLFALSAITLALLAGASTAFAQSAPPPLPAMTAEQSAALQQRLDPYRRETDDRVSRGEITADEADRLLQWREWQIARQVAGASSSPAPAVDGAVPPVYHEAAPREYAPPRAYVPPRDYVVVEPAPYYVPYYRYRPHYWAPPPYYWGPTVCAGGFGRHFGGRICF